MWRFTINEENLVPYEFFLFIFTKCGLLRCVSSIYKAVLFFNYEKQTKKLENVTGRKCDLTRIRSHFFQYNRYSMNFFLYGEFLGY